MKHSEHKLEFIACFLDKVQNLIGSKSYIGDKLYTFRCWFQDLLYPENIR